MWGFIYLILTIVTVWWVSKERVCYIGAAGLLMWMVMERLVYERGAVESVESIVISVLFLCYVGVAYYYVRARLFIVLGLVGLGVVTWSEVYVGTDAYLFKAIKNLLYVIGLGAIWMRYLHYSRSLALP